MEVSPFLVVEAEAAGQNVRGDIGQQVAIAPGVGTQPDQTSARLTPSWTLIMPVAWWTSAR